MCCCVVVLLLLLSLFTHSVASIQVNDRYGDQYAIMFSLAMTQLKQVEEDSEGQCGCVYVRTVGKRSSVLIPISVLIVSCPCCLGNRFHMS